MSDDSMLQERKATYDGFVRLCVVSSAAVAATLVFLAVILL